VTATIADLKPHHTSGLTYGEKVNHLNLILLHSIFPKKMAAAQLVKIFLVCMNQNLIQEEIKRRLNSGNACYHSVQSLLSSHLLSKNLKIRMYKTIILPVVLYGSETWSLTLRGEHRLRVFENRVLRRIFGQNRDEVTGEWRKSHNEELRELFAKYN
jgi:hypothetical protein